MVFANPWLLWILVPLYALWAMGWAAQRWFERQRRLRAHAALRFSSIESLKRLAPSRSLLLRRGIETLRLLSVALLLAGLTRPQTGRKESRITTDGVDIMLAIDTSGSMQALDLDADQPIPRRRNRLAVVKKVVEGFIQKRDTDQVGMVVFGGDAYTQCPLTLDHGIVATFLDRIEPGMAGDMTAIGSGLGAAVNRLRKSHAKSKVIILLTDGRNNAGGLSPKKAAEVAHALGIKVYTIGAGGRGQAPFVVEGVFGKQLVYDNVDIDEDTLREIATLTGGAYFRAEDTAGLQKIYDQIDALEKTEIQMKSYMEYTERFSWFVIPALGLLLVEVVLLGTRFRKIP
ncbi:MAG TPA: VWA domain-containing protein [Myxococcota bacterium]|nr:VWA domain-containing protein [Myxococcota bacterium]